MERLNLENFFWRGESVSLLKSSGQTAGQIRRQTGLQDLFLRDFNDVQFIRYANMTIVKKRKFIQSIKNIPHARYLFTEDLDKDICITHKKEEVQTDCPVLEPERILIVAWEIESWYAAGLDSNDYETLGIRGFTDTNTLTKDCNLTMWYSKQKTMTEQHLWLSASIVLRQQ